MIIYGLVAEVKVLICRHSLRQSDRDALRKGASTVGTHATIGSAIGVTLGVYLAFRLRRSRAAMFTAFRAREQPTAVKFAGGREEPLPDLRQMMKPSTFGDVATYTLLGAGGLFFGGETGLLTGTFRARQQIGGDRESRERIETAFRRYGLMLSYDVVHMLTLLSHVQLSGRCPEKTS